MYEIERCENEACGNRNCGMNNSAVEFNCEGGEQDIGVCSFYYPLERLVMRHLSSWERYEKYLATLKKRVIDWNDFHCRCRYRTLDSKCNQCTNECRPKNCTYWRKMPVA